MSEVIRPRDVLPMQLNDELNQRKLQNMTGLELVVGQLVAVESMNVSKAFLSAQLAIADATWKQEFLFIAGQAIQDSGTERRDKFRGKTFMILTMDTSLAALGDPVYLSGAVAGAVTLTPPANIRKVGQVVTVGVAGKVVIAPHMFQGFGFTPFTLDQKWRDEFNATFEAPAGKVTIYVDNVLGNDVTGTGAVGTPYASLAKTILTIPQHRDDLDKDIIHIRLVNNGAGTPYDWGGQSLVGSLDRILIQGLTDTSVNLAQFTPAAVLVNGTIEITQALPGVLNDDYKGTWLYIGQGVFDFTDPDNYAHVSASTYSGGGIHVLYVSDRRAAGTWTVPLTLFDPSVLLPHVNLRPGVFVPGLKSSFIYGCADLHLQNIYFQNLTQLRLQGNDPVLFDGCYAETMAWYIDGGTCRLQRTYIVSSTAVPDHGCLDLDNGATLELMDGNTMDGTNVLAPNAGLTTGTLASLWLRGGSHVHISGGLWQRSHAHITVDKGTFHRSNDGAIAIVSAVQQGGPGYTVPGYVTARLAGTGRNQAGNYPGGELALFGAALANFEYVIAAVGHDIALADDGDLQSTHTAVPFAWLSADGGAGKSSYDPGKGTRVRMNDPDLTGMHELISQTQTALVNWARGEDQMLDLTSENPETVTITFRHPRLGGTHKLWVKGRSNVGTTGINWPATVTWAAGAPPVLGQNLYQLYVFEYLPDTGKYYGRHVEVDVV